MVLLSVPLHLYVVDMTPDYLEELFRILPDYVDCESETYSSGVAFVDSLQHRKFSRTELHVVLLTYEFGYGSSYVMNGLEVLEVVRQKHPFFRFIMLSQNKELEYTMKAKSLGAYEVINREQIALQIFSILMKLLSEDRLPLARRRMGVATLRFAIALFCSVIAFYLYLYVYG